MMLSAIENDQACRECLHMAGEHDSVIGCRHGYMERGERLECVCSHFTQ